ncbi:hypothetical protein LguiB_031229 [Lonicera macranthoides]
MMAVKRSRELDGGWSKEYEGVESLAMNDCNRLLSRIDKPPQRTFKCKTCDRWFDSFQALGGHTASHSTKAGDSPKNQKIHRCSKCGAVFSSGQALGGHMRRHLNTSPSPDSEEAREMNSSSNRLPQKIIGTSQVSRDCSPTRGGIDFSSGQALGDHMGPHPNTSPNSTESNGNTPLVPRGYNPVRSFDLNLSPMEEEINFPDENYHPDEENYSKLKIESLEERGCNLPDRDASIKFHHFL